MKVAISGIGMAVAAALTLGAASIASAQQSNPSGTLMQERQGAMGTEKGAEKPAAQSGNLSGKDAPSAEDEAKAATGQATQGGSLNFGAKGNGDDDKSLPAQRQGTIGTQERPPEPTTQGGGEQEVNPILRDAACRKVTSARRFRIPSARSGAGPAIPSRAATRGRCRPGYRLSRARSPCPSPPTAP